MKDPRELQSKTESVEASISNLRRIIEDRHPPATLSAHSATASPITVRLGVAQRLSGHEGKVLSVSWAGTGSSSNPAALYTLASVSVSGEVALWNTRKAVLVSKGQVSDSWLMTCAFEKQNCVSLAIGGRTGKCWVLGVNYTEAKMEMKPKAVFQAHSNYVSGVEFVSNSEMISVAGDGLCKLWSVENTANPISEFRGHTEDVMCVSVCPVNPSLFLSGGCDHSVKLWDAREPSKPKRSFDWHTSDVNSVRFFPHSVFTYVSACADGCLQVWDVRALHAVGRYQWSNSPIAAVSVSASGRLLFSANEAGEIAVTDTFSSHAPIQLLTDHRAKVTDLELSPLGTTLASCSLDKTILVYQPLNLRD